MTIQNKELRIERFYVGGITCSFCASTIERGLSKVNGVEAVKVFLESGEVIIRYDNSSVRPELLKKGNREIRLLCF